MSRTPNDSYSNAFLTHGDLWRQVLSFLPFSFVKSNLHSINHFFHDLAHAVTNPTMLGSLPVQVWSNHILPLLDCVELKNFQRVSQVSKILTLSPSFAKKMFRSDVDTKDLKSIKVGTNLADSRDYYAVNPFLDKITGICAEPYESFYVYVYMSSKYIQRQSSKTHGVETYSARHENATNPPVSQLKLDVEPPNTVYEGSYKKEIVKVVGSGRPLFGGKEKAVTCRDVMIAFAKYASRFDQYDDHAQMSMGFNSFKKAKGGFVLGRVMWES